MFRRLVLAGVAVIVCGAPAPALATISQGEEATAAYHSPTIDTGDELIPPFHRMALLLEFELSNGWLEALGAPAGPPRLSPAERAVTVFFDFDRAELTPAANGAIDGFLRGIEGPVEVVVAGHADRAGPARYNLGLSQRRAEAVKAALVDRGFQVEAVHDLRIVGKGEAEPAVSTPDGVPAPANRRAVVTILKPDNVAQYGFGPVDAKHGGAGWMMVLRLSPPAGRR